jgi:hypothetical protein
VSAVAQQEQEVERSMTYQRDPDQPRTPFGDERPNWGALPLFILAVALIGVGIIALSHMGDNTTPSPSPTQSTQPGGATPKQP